MHRKGWTPAVTDRWSSFGPVNENSSLHRSLDVDSSENGTLREIRAGASNHTRKGGP